MPPTAAELVLFVVNTVDGHLFFDWAIAGLHPALRGISAGVTPSGSVVGRNSFGHVGYRVCPGTGATVHYIIRLLALPSRLKVVRGFDAASLYRRVERLAEVVGLNGMTYRSA